MVNLVIVSHSSRLGEGVGELARQMLMSDSCKIAIAAGIDDPQNPIGTDAVKVMEAIESVADADHVLVMMAPKTMAPIVANTMSTPSRAISANTTTGVKPHRELSPGM